MCGDEELQLEFTRLYTVITRQLAKAKPVSAPATQSHACTVHTTPTCTAPHTSSTTTLSSSAYTSEDIPLLVEEVEDLRARCISLEKENARLKALLENAAPTPQISAKRWQDQANEIIGAESSRKTPMYEYNCAHASPGQEASGHSGHATNCSWTQKRTTLLAYIKHLQEKHGENIRKHPVSTLLPVRSDWQPSDSIRQAEDNKKAELAATHTKKKERAAKKLIIANERDSSRLNWFIERNGGQQMHYRRSARLSSKPRLNYRIK